jgi:class 3 adenylate cyclase/tetratricopeptide (TPR) repeat protein
MGCGVALVVTCPACQQAIPRTARFCSQCGTALAGTEPPGAPPAGSTSLSPQAYTPRHLAEKILTSRHTLEGERKQITVLFADVSESMALIQHLDTEDGQRLLDGAVRIMMDAVHRYEGTVSRALGDGIMALFGAPIAHEDHALRACYAALAMQSAMRRYAQEVREQHDLEPEIRVGLNSGEVVVRLVSDDLHMDYTAMGRSVHLASRMEQLAEAGSIRLTADTVALVEGYVQVQALGPVAVRGLAEPIDVFELTGPGLSRTRLQAAAARGLTRFIGRDAELVALLVAQARVDAGQGQVVAAVGEPGMGKSRLFYEFVRSSSTTGWRVLESVSVAYSQATPYLPVVDLLKAYCEIDERDDAATIRARLLSTVLGLDPELAWCLPPLLSLLDVPVDDPDWQALDPPLRRARTLAACQELFLAASRRQPLVLVLENLHWIDSETQALLDRLVDALPAARILLLVNYRPEYRPAWGASGSYSQIQLGPLPPDRVGELLGSLVGHDPSVAALTSDLVERTAGNPFFVEECIHTLVETGALIGERGAYRLASPQPYPELPATVQAVLAARIDRLGPADKQILQAAAVIGKDVPFVLLSAIVELPEPELRGALARLQAAELLLEASLFPELEYTFKHALTREVAYRGLLQDRRRSVHGRVMTAIERLYADRLIEQAERLADHAFQSESWEQAYSYLTQAGKKAADRWAVADAIARYEQALVALGHLPDDLQRPAQSIDLRFELRNLLFMRGEFPRVMEHLRDAEEIAKILGDRRRLAWTHTYLSNSAWQIGQYDRAIEYGRRALATATDLGDTELRVLATFRLGQAYHGACHFAEAVELLQQNVAQLQGELLRERFGLAGAPAIFSRAFATWSLAELGEFAPGLNLGEEAVEIAESVDQPYSLTIACFSIGVLHARAGNLEAARVSLERALGVSRDRGITVLFPVIASSLAYVYALEGRNEVVPELAEQSVEPSAVAKATHPSFPFLRAAEAHLLIGRTGRAVDLARHAFDLAVEHRERGHQAYALRLLAETSLRRVSADLESAESLYRQAEVAASDLEMRPLQAHCLLGRGRLLRRLGRFDEARTALSHAVELFDALGMTHWLSEAQTEQVEATAMRTGHLTG